MKKMSFIENLSNLIEHQGITKNKMLKDLHMGTGTFATWQKRGTIPSGETLSKIADYFGVTTDYLLNGEKAKNIEVYDENDNIVVIDDETREIIDSLRKRPDMKILFSVSKKATKEDIIQAVKIIEALRDSKEGD